MTPSYSKENPWADGRLVREGKMTMEECYLSVIIKYGTKASGQQWSKQAEHQESPGRKYRTEIKHIRTYFLKTTYSFYTGSKYIQTS